MLTDKKPEDPDLKQIGLLITVPFILAVPPIAGLLIGKWLDKIFGTAPYLMYIFLVIGVIAGIREFYRLLKKVNHAD